MYLIIILLLVSSLIFACRKAVEFFSDYLYEKYASKKHFCNKCQNAFILRKKDRALTHCLECGEALTELFPLNLENLEFEEKSKEVFEEFENRGEDE